MKTLNIFLSSFFSLSFAVFFLAIVPNSAAASTMGVSMPLNYLGMVGWWTFDGPKMFSNVTDSSGRNNNGKLLHSGSGTTTVAGRAGQALMFDGVNDEVNLDLLTDLDFSQEDAFTVAAWVYPKGTASTKIIFGRASTFTSAANVVYYFAINNTLATRYSSQISDGTNLISATAAAGTVSRDKWQHLVLLWDGTTLILYKNTVSIATGVNVSFTGLWDGNTAAKKETSIGANGTTEAQTWPGGIDDVRVYGRALSTTEIQQLYNLAR